MSNKSMEKDTSGKQLFWHVSNGIRTCWTFKFIERRMIRKHGKLWVFKALSIYYKPIPIMVELINAVHEND